MTASTAPNAAPVPPTRADALRYWWKLGWISFGGPAGQIAIMHRDLVDQKHWISEQRFLHALNYCMLLPGPEAQQLATYIGWLMHRTWGGIVAGGLFVLPSLLVLIVLSWLYMAYGNVPAIAGVLYAIKPAVTAIVLHAAWRIGSRTLKTPLLIAIAVTAFVAIYAFAVPFPLIILAAGVVGVLGNRFAPGQFVTSSASHAPAGKGTGADAPHANDEHAAAIIDDSTPTPEHARFRWSRLIAVVAAGLLLWAATLALLATMTGADSVLTRMGWFFSQAALVTFGGAYAVLPYVLQHAVEHYGWLTAPQVIDGLALGETTPGPLIMVVAFVGFVGAWSRQIFDAHLFLAGAAGAAVATWFTFLPSFVFILAGGPVVESTHGRAGLKAPLSAITAAVVGVIVNLAVYFAYHVLMPQGSAGQFDYVAALIGIAAAIALFRLKVGVIPLLAGCAAVGLALTALHLGAGAR